MKTKNSQPQTGFFLQMVVKALFISTTLFMLGSFTTAHAQKRSILLSPINFEQGCPSLEESVVQVSIDGVQMASRGTTSVSPGTHNLRVTANQSSFILTIKEIEYLDWDSATGGTAVLKTQTFAVNKPEANESITVYNPNTNAAAKLTITVACGGAAPQQRLPIIFMAGMAGTTLVAELKPRFLGPTRKQEVWPIAGQVEYLGLSEDGKTPALPNSKIITGGILATPGSLVNFYYSMISYLISKGYDYRDMPLAGYNKPDLFPFDYDWRLDNQEHFTKLDDTINYALSKNPNAKKVILLAHSMGGVIARAYILSSPDRAAKVDSLITMGTPYWGATIPYYALVSGYTFGNPWVDKEMMKLLAQNFPSAYQTLPNYEFIYDDTNRRMLTMEEAGKIKYKGFTDYTPGLFKGKYDESPDNIGFFNPRLVRMAQAFVGPFGRRENPSRLLAGVKHYVIIGVGVKTLKYFIMSDFRPPERFLELGGRSVVIKPVFGDGDGTVPLQGSEISSDKKVGASIAATYYIPYMERWGPDNSSGHSDLPSNKTVQKIIGEIIDGKPPDPSKYDLPNPKLETELKDLEPGVDFNLHSDAYLNITDQSTGRKLGVNSQGGIDETLPSGTLLAIEGVEYASIADINRPLGVTVTGIRDGKFTLDVNIRRRGGAATQFSYREVPVKKGTIAQVTMTPGQISYPPPLTVTTDGRTTTIPASIGNAGGPVITQGGAQIPTGPLPPGTPPSSGGIGGTWVTPSGDTITLTQNGNRVTGTYRGAIGTGTLTGTLDGSTFAGTIEVGQAGITVTDTFSLRLTPEGRLEGQVGSSVFKVDVVLVRR